MAATAGAGLGIILKFFRLGRNLYNKKILLPHKNKIELEFVGSVKEEKFRRRGLPSSTRIAVGCGAPPHPFNFKENCRSVIINKKRRTDRNLLRTEGIIENIQSGISQYKKKPSSPYNNLQTGRSSKIRGSP